jgi:hypothetical protein
MIPYCSWKGTPTIAEKVASSTEIEMGKAIPGTTVQQIGSGLVENEKPSKPPDPMKARTLPNDCPPGAGVSESRKGARPVPVTFRVGCSTTSSGEDGPLSVKKSVEAVRRE